MQPLSRGRDVHTVVLIGKFGDRFLPVHGTDADHRIIARRVQHRVIPRGAAGGVSRSGYQNDALCRRMGDRLLQRRGDLAYPKAHVQDLAMIVVHAAVNGGHDVGERAVFRCKALQRHDLRLGRQSRHAHAVAGGRGQDAGDERAVPHAVGDIAPLRAVR